MGNSLVFNNLYICQYSVTYDEWVCIELLVDEATACGGALIIVRMSFHS